MIQQNSSEFDNTVNEFKEHRLRDRDQNFIDSSIHYYEHDGQKIEASDVPSKRSKPSEASYEQEEDVIGAEHEHPQEEDDADLRITERTDNFNDNDSFQNEDELSKG